MKILIMLAGGALLLGADGVIAQSASPSAKTNPPISCPMGGRGMDAGAMGVGTMGPGGAGNMQQMQAMHTQMHDDMQAMQKQMAAMRTEMQAMHQEMMKMHQGMAKHH